MERGNTLFYAASALFHNAPPLKQKTMAIKPSLPQPDIWLASLAPMYASAVIRP